MRRETSRIIGTVALLLAMMVSTARAQIYGPWLAPVNLNNMSLNDGAVCPAVVNSTSPDVNDTHPAISKDGLSLYFASTRPGPDAMGHNGQGDYDIWVTHRDSLDSCWGPPLNVEAVNSKQQDFAPNLTPDGHWLYFHSARPTWVRADGVAAASCGGLDLYVSHRTDIGNDFGWENPVNLGCNTINTSGFDQAGPSYFEDVATSTNYLYYTQKPTPPPGTRNDSAWDIYVSTCPGDLATCNTPNKWGPGVPVDRLNSPVRDTRTAIRRDGLEMILSTGRTGSLANENLWVSTRPAVTLDQQNWALPEPINCDDTTGFTSPNTGMFVLCSPWNPQGPFVNSDAFDGGPALSWDGTELYFFRVRADNLNTVSCTVLPTSPDTDTSPYCRDLYRSTRTYITNTALSSSPNPSVFGQSITFTATVSSANDSAPTGTVAFSDGSASLGAGTVASGQASFTTSSLAVGSHSITGQYSGDRISSVSSGSLTQNVQYGICPLFDQTRSVHSGATFPIKLQLCDVNGNGLSSSAIVVHATSVTTVSGYSGTPDAPGNANPDNDFRFDATLGTTGGYIFNLSTGGLASGTYSLQFTVGGDPVTHSVNFGVN